jgi:pimeloyl-ACP methyl ester carboxylesterase
LGELRALLADPVFAGEGIEHGEGEPVLVVPGALSHDRWMQTMTAWLRRTGHHATAARMGVNLDCGERAIGRLEARLERLVHHRGRRAAIVGHSRGGSFARVLAVRRPDLVSGIVTLATPIMTWQAAHPLLRLPLRAFSVLGSLGVPGVLHASCFDGGCCERFREQACGPFPPELSFLRVVPERDGIVGPRFFGDDDAETIRVDATHVGVIVNAAAYRALAHGLSAARDADRLR